MSSNKKKKVFSPYKSIVSKIEEVTKIKRINMRELGSELGVTVSAVSDYSKKDYIPSETMMKWCARRQVSIDWVLNNQSDIVGSSSSEKLNVEEEIMYRLKYEESQDKLIAALEEVSFLKDLLAKKANSQAKKAG